MSSIEIESLLYSFSHSSFDTLLKKFLWFFSISFFMYSNSFALDEKRGEIKTKRSDRKEISILGNLVFMVREYH